MWSSRTIFIVFSLLVHGAFAFGIGELEVKKSHAATAIEFAQTKKPVKKPIRKLHYLDSNNSSGSDHRLAT